MQSEICLELEDLRDRLETIQEQHNMLDRLINWKSSDQTPLMNI